MLEDLPRPWLTGVLSRSAGGVYAMEGEQPPLLQRMESLGLDPLYEVPGQRGALPSPDKAPLSTVLAGRVKHHHEKRIRVLFNITKDAVFNVAFDYKQEKWRGIARWYSDPTNSMACAPHPHFQVRGKNVSNGRLAYSSDVATKPFTNLELPHAVHCDNTGEPKWVGSVLPGYVVGYTHGVCTAFGNLPKLWKLYWGAQGFDRNSPVTRNYLDNHYRGFLFDAEARNGPLYLLSYQRRPEQNNPVAKNFLFFKTAAVAYAIALFNPHVIYRMNLSTGLMVHAHETVLPPASIDHPKVGLSAGPVRWNSSMFIAAAHASRGGWKNAYRMTFFYTFESTPPFRVLCVTPVVNFGLSATLEYCTGLLLSVSYLYVSLGYDNCHSALVRYPVSAVLAQCR